MTDLVLETTTGPIRGRARRGAQLYANIPYAEPPTGSRRFDAPHPRAGWTGVRDATRFGPASPQLPGEGLLSAVPLPWDEDSLVLNVVTPAADDGRRPVMVWVHGGDFRHGTSATPWYDGTSFALDGDIVVVTVNYRLGALGFGAVDDGASGRAGLLDQIAALEWVRDNIECFGGDPRQVTIAGESAGAFSCAALLTMPAASGLFHRAILQSGAGHQVIDATMAEEVAAALLAAAGAGDASALRCLPALDILQAQQRVEADKPAALPRWQSPFYPSVHPEQLPARPVDAMASGASADVAVLTGTNEHETAIWGVMATDTERLERVCSHYVASPAELLDVYRAGRPGASAGELAVALTSDFMFGIPAVRLSEARAGNGGRTFVYRFDWESRALDGMLRACHALEIPFVFDNLDAAGVEHFLGPGPRPRALAERMHRAWIAFIRHGDPSTDEIGAWPDYRPEARSVMRFGRTCATVTDPRPAEREAWAGIR